MVRSFLVLSSLFSGCFVVGAQTSSGDVLVTAKDVRLTAADLSAETSKRYAALPVGVARIRTELFSGFLADRLIETEAQARNLSPEAVRAEALRSVADPTEAEIKAVYEANREELGDKPLDEVKKTIVDFLRREPEQKAVHALVERLRVKHGLVIVKEIASPGLKPVDIVARIGARTLLARDFELAERFALADSVAHLYDEFHLSLEDEVMNRLLQLEAKERGSDVSSIIATEITNRLRDYTEEERVDLEDRLRRRLFSKYGVRFPYQRPAPLVQNISVDDDPVRGGPAAEVTIVMFSDFQCPACARTHPILERVLREYGGRVRLVVRDFPLEEVHKDAFGAARAANAAHLQGRFWEYIEIMYRNQDALDAASLKRYAVEIGIDIKRFEADIANDSNAAEIRQDISDARGYGVSGTPTIFVNGIKVHRLSAPALRDAIELALKK